MSLSNIFIDGPDYCNRLNIPVDQWVEFEHYKEKLPCDMSGPFKVLSRTNNPFIFTLQKRDGTISKYHPETSLIGKKELPWGYRIKVVYVRSCESDTLTIRKKALEKLPPLKT